MDFREFNNATHTCTQTSQIEKINEDAARAANGKMRQLCMLNSEVVGGVQEVYAVPRVSASGQRMSSASTLRVKHCCDQRHMLS